MNPRCRRAATLALMLAAGGLCSAAQAQITANWLNPVNGNWGDATQWSTNPTFPNNSGPNIYNVFIATSGSPYTVTLDQPITINDFHLTSPDAALDLTTNTLTVNGNWDQSGSQVRGPGGAGIVNVAGTATFSGSFAVEALDGVGAFHVNTLVISPISPIDICDTDVFHDGSTSSWASGDIHLNEGAKFHENASGTFNITGNGSLAYTGLGTRSAFLNAGTIRKSAGAGASSFSGVDLDNTGTVQVEAGTFSADRPVQVAGSTLTGGKWNVFSGSTLDLTGATITTNAGEIHLRDPGSTFNAINGLATIATGGKFLIDNGRNFSATPTQFKNDGTLIVGSGTTFSAQHDLLSESSTMTGPGNISVQGDLKFNAPTGGAVVNGGAQIQSQGRLFFSGPTTTTITAASSINHTGTTAQWDGSGDIAMGDGSSLSLAAASTFSILTDHTMSWDNIGARPTLTNAGTLLKSTGTGVSFFYGVQVNNTGTVEVDTGTLRANQVPTPGNTLPGGKWVVKSMLDLPGSTIATNKADVTLDGAASFFAQLESNLATNDTAGKLTIQNGRNLTTAFGAGDFTNNGKITVGTGTTFAVAAGRNLTNYSAGTQTLTGGTLAVSGTFKFDSADIRTDASDITLDGAPSAIRSTAGADALANLGTVAPTGKFAIQNNRNFLTGGNFTVDQSGVQKGVLTIGAGTLFRVAPGSTMTNFAGNTFNLGQFNILGTLQFDNAAINLINNNVVLSGSGSHIIDQFGNDAFQNLHTIQTGGDLSVTLGKNLNVSANLTLQGRLGIGPDGALDSSSIVSVAGNFTQDPGGILDLDSGILNIAGTATFNGTISGNGSINGSVVANGMISPGHSPGLLRIGGNLSLNPGSALEMQLGGPEAASGYDQLMVQGGLTFPAGGGATLNVSLINGFAVSFGQAFELIPFGSVSGAFSDYHLPDIEPLHWDVAYTQTGLTLTAVPAPSGLALGLLALVARRRRTAVSPAQRP